MTLSALCGRYLRSVMIFQSRHCIQPPQPTCGSPAVSWKGGREDEGGWKVADLVGARVGGYVHKSHLEHVHGGDGKAD